MAIMYFHMNCPIISIQSSNSIIRYKWVWYTNQLNLLLEAYQSTKMVEKYFGFQRWFPHKSITPLVEPDAGIYAFPIILSVPKRCFWFCVCYFNFNSTAFVIHLHRTGKLNIKYKPLESDHGSIRLVSLFSHRIHSANTDNNSFHSGDLYTSIMYYWFIWIINKLRLVQIIN